MKKNVVKLIDYLFSSICLIGIFIRQLHYELSLKYCGKNLMFIWKAYIVYPDVVISDDCTIKEFCILRECILGNDAILVARVSIMNDSKHHEVNEVTTTFSDSESECHTVRLGSNLWIGTHAIIMNDIGDNTVVGASAVVTRAIPSMVDASGGPAKAVKYSGVCNV